LVSGHQWCRSVAQTMPLASLMRHPRPHLRNGKTQRPLIITDHPANPMAQRCDRLEDASLEGGVSSREDGHHLQNQAKL